MAVEKVGQDETKRLGATCKNCGAVLSFYQKDIKFKTFYSYGEQEAYCYVDCPECNTNVEVKRVK